MRFMFLIFLPFSIFASDIHTLANIAYKNNPQFKLLDNKIKSNEFDILNSTIENNPILSLGITDINIDKPLKRDLEAMQTQFISLSQKFTNNNKLNANKDIYKVEKQIIKTSIQHTKELILKKLYSYYFEYTKLQLDKKILNKYITNIKQIQKFHNNHINHKQAYQASIQNDLNLENLQIRLLKINQQIEIIFINISELTNQKITSINSNNKLIYNNKLAINHSALELANLQIKKEQAKQNLLNTKTSSDFTINAGYYIRESRDDYINLAIMFPLQVSDIEDNRVKQSTYKIEESKNDLEVLKNKLNNAMQTNLSNIKFSTLTLNSLDKVIKLQNKELKLITSQNNINTLIKALELKNNILSNELKKNTQNYLYNLAKLELSYLSANLRINHE